MFARSDLPAAPRFRAVVVGTAALALAALLAAGCATGIAGSTRSIAVISDPPGADVLVGGNPAGKTPTVLTLVTGRPYTVELRKEGFAGSRAEIVPTFNELVLLNIFGGVVGLAGLVIDLMTDAAWDLDPELVFVTLRETAAGPPVAGADSPPQAADPAAAHPPVAGAAPAPAPAPAPATATDVETDRPHWAN